MEKIPKEQLASKQLIVNYNKLYNPTRIRLRKKLNKNLDDMISGVSEIEKSISKLPNKVYKRYNVEIIEDSVNGKYEYLVEEDKKMDLIQFN